MKNAPAAGFAGRVVDDLPIYLTIAGSIKSKHWDERVATWGAFKEVLGEHPEWLTKDGLSYLPGKLSGTERKKNAVEALYLLVLDSDRGDDLAEIAARIRALATPRWCTRAIRISLPRPGSSSTTTGATPAPAR